MLTADSVKDALKGVKYPGYSRDIVSFGLVKDVSIKEGKVSVKIELTAGTPEVARQIETSCHEALQTLPGAPKVEVDIRMTGATGATAGSATQNKLPGIRRIIAVASGKGGVGKSTVAVNLACALRISGAEVGLLDCDIYGPTIPLMMGTSRKPVISADEKLVPPVSHGVKLMSMGFIVEGDAPVIWRGPMIQKTVQQFIHAVDWGKLDYLLVDLPPGTGDAQLSLCQTVPLDGGVIVTTPQEASLGVVRKGIAMFQKVNVPILGLVENMSYFTTPQGERIEIFGHGGGRQEAARQGVPFLGEIPLFPAIREAGDQGTPIVVAGKDRPESQPFFRIAEGLQRLLDVA